MIWTDLGRAVLLGAVPLAAVTGVLRIQHLYFVAFFVGVLTVFFDVAYQAFLPSLVQREQLVEGNSKLEGSRSFAQIAGPGLGGGLVQLVTAPFALLADSLSFVVSAVFLSGIRTREPMPASAPSGSLAREIGEGLRLVVENPLLRANAGCTSTWNLFSHALQTIFILYAVRELGLEPAIIGLILGAVGPGALVGAMVAGPLGRRVGVGPAIILSAFLGGLSNLVVPLAGGLPSVAAPLLIGGFLMAGIAGTAYNVNTVSLRQAITADNLQGRMNATIRFMTWGSIPIGSLVGGALGETLGLRPTLALAALGVQVSFVWALLSPLRGLREPPTKHTRQAS